MYSAALRRTKVVGETLTGESCPPAQRMAGAGFLHMHRAAAELNMQDKLSFALPSSLYEKRNLTRQECSFSYYSKRNQNA